VAVDRASTGTDDGVETVDKQQAAEAPPPPPDRPGAEGAPSRADSRAAAAAPVDNNPQEPRDKEQAATAEDNPTSDSPADCDVQDEQNPADVPDADRQETQEGRTPVEDGASTTGAEDSPDQQFGPEETPRVDDAILDEELKPAKDPAEAADQRVADQEKDTDAGEQPADVPVETAEDQRAQDHRPQSDQPETEETPPPADARADATDTEQADNTADAESTDQAPDAGQTAEPPGESRDVSPAAEINDNPPETADPSERSDNAADTTEGEETTGDADAAFADGSETPAHRPEEPDDDAELAPQGSIEVEDSTEGNRRPGDRNTDQDQAADQHPAPAGTEDVEEPPDLPTGEELLEMEGDDESKADKLRRKAYERTDDLFDIAGKVTQRLDDIFHRPPTDSHAVVKTDHPVIEAPHQGINTGEAATALLATGIVVAELYRWGHNKFRRNERN
jgi:hypothetical protein